MNENMNVGQKVVLKQSRTYPVPVTVAAVSKSGICVQLPDVLETLLVFYRHRDGTWHDGSGASVVITGESE